MFSEKGSPNAYITGVEGGGAVVVGLRYGDGDLFMKASGDRPAKVYWQGPSVGFDLGGNASKVFVLVYNLPNTEAIYQRFPGVEGSAYVVAGVGVNYQQNGRVILAPMRTGVGLRLAPMSGTCTTRRSGTSCRSEQSPSNRERAGFSQAGPFVLQTGVDEEAAIRWRARSAPSRRATVPTTPIAAPMMIASPSRSISPSPISTSASAGRLCAKGMGIIVISASTMQMTPTTRSMLSPVTPGNRGFRRRSNQDSTAATRGTSVLKAARR